MWSQAQDKPEPGQVLHFEWRILLRPSPYTNRSMQGQYSVKHNKMFCINVKLRQKSTYSFKLQLEGLIKQHIFLQQNKNSTTEF